MTVRRGFDSFGDVVDSFVKAEMNRYNKTLINRSYANGQDYNMYRNIPLLSSGVLSSIRDVNDEVMYFMIGVDRVEGPSKIGA